jgi:DNA-binding transcriptional MocR family regulator
MTPAEEARFIQLWTAGTTQTAIAQALGIPRGTVASRAYHLVRQGKIQPRPKGGAYPHQQALARQEQLPVHSRADPSPEPMHPPVHPVHTVQAQLYALHGAVQQTVESPIDLRELLQEAMAPVRAQVAALEAEIRALRLHSSAPVHTGVYALHGAEHTDLSPEERKSERWNIYMPRWLRQIIEAEAQATRLSPSQVLQDMVKAWVEQRRQGVDQGRY